MTRARPPNYRRLDQLQLRSHGAALHVYVFEIRRWSSCRNFLEQPLYQQRRRCEARDGAIAHSSMVPILKPGWRGGPARRRARSHQNSVEETQQTEDERKEEV